jgi:hypothetical protein
MTLRITIDSTDQIVELDCDGGRMPARIWAGATEGGIPVMVLVTRISPQTHDEAANAAFAAELKEQRNPTILRSAIDLRFII